MGNNCAGLKHIQPIPTQEFIAIVPKKKKSNWRLWDHAKEPTHYLSWNWIKGKEWALILNSVIQLCHWIKNSGKEKYLFIDTLQLIKRGGMISISIFPSCNLTSDCWYHQKGKVRFMPADKITQYHLRKSVKLESDQASRFNYHLQEI